LINLVIKKPKRNHCHTLHKENVGLPHSAQAARISSTAINLRKKSRIRARFTLSGAEKMGALHLGRQILFFLEKTGGLFSHHRPCVRCQFSSKTGDLFLLITLVHSRVAHYFRHAKIWAISRNSPRGLMLPLY